MIIPATNVENVSVVLGNELVLKNVNLKVFHGDTIVIMGTSGSGKTGYRPSKSEGYIGRSFNRFT